MTASPLYSCLDCQVSPGSSNQSAHDAERIVPAWEEIEGTPTPLGVTWVGTQKAWNAAIYSRHAASVTLLLFNDDLTRPAYELKFDPVQNKSGGRLALSCCIFSLSHGEILRMAN